MLVYQLVILVISNKKKKKKIENENSYQVFLQLLLHILIEQVYVLVFAVN